MESKVLGRREPFSYLIMSAYAQSEPAQTPVCLFHPQGLEWISGCCSPRWTSACNRSYHQQQHARNQIGNRIGTADFIEEARQEAGQEHGGHEADAESRRQG